MSSEALITATFDKLISEGKTVVVVAHRLQTLKHAHHIIKIGEDGVIVQGPPEFVLTNLFQVKLQKAMSKCVANQTTRYKKSECAIL